MIKTQVIKNFYGQTVGYVEEDTITGNKTIKNFYKQILGYYNKKEDKTRNFYKQIVARGDASTSLIDFSGGTWNQKPWDNNKKWEK